MRDCPARRAGGYRLLLPVGTGTICRYIGRAIAPRGIDGLALLGRFTRRWDPEVDKIGGSRGAFAAFFPRDGTLRFENLESSANGALAERGEFRKIQLAPPARTGASVAA